MTEFDRKNNIIKQLVEGNIRNVNKHEKTLKEMHKAIFVDGVKQKKSGYSGVTTPQVVGDGVSLDTLERDVANFGDDGQVLTLNRVLSYIRKMDNKILEKMDKKQGEI